LLSQFCNFNGVDRLCQNEAGRDTGADGIITGADRNGVLQLPLLAMHYGGGIWALLAPAAGR
jgi:hypothetical protein